ncbi:MAG: glycerophosphodiester phosphodiesterase family protein [Gemmatimonadota bacterium]
MQVPPSPVPGVRIIGHRGDPGRAPENTLPSIRAAIEAGADGVEWDIHVCGSGEPVLIHDATVDRTTDGTGAVADLPLSRLRELDAGSWFGERHGGTPIPTLGEALDLVHPSGMEIHCEIKGVRDPADAAGILEEFRRRALLPRVFLISFDAGILEALLLQTVEWGNSGGDLRVGQIVGEDEGLEEALEWVRGTRGAILSPDRRILLSDPERTRGWIEEGLTLSPWTVDHPAEADDLAGMGVARLTTNRVRDMLDWRARRGPEGGSPS